jgi:hypothetical protein
MQRFNFLASPFAHETNSVPGVMEDGAEPPKIARLNKVAIRTKRKIVFVDPAEVFAVEAQGNSVLLRTSSRSYVLRQSISRVAKRLSQYGFVRIHRSTIQLGRDVSSRQRGRPRIQRFPKVQMRAEVGRLVLDLRGWDRRGSCPCFASASISHAIRIRAADAAANDGVRSRMF